MSDAAAALRELSAALRVVHQRGLTATQKGFERLHGRVRSAGEVLQLALHDPLFAWLRPLSALIATLDELAAQDEVGGEDLDSARAAVATFLESDGEFRPAYLVYLQTEPDLVLAHAGVRRLLAPDARPRSGPMSGGG
jgi:hypothetical protein